ncbi:MAG: barstar family protein [Pseudoalteromonas prydzensis]|uniref:barstar family protein n=1 Tax=Pseudoalteromonas prydzensis TaxID=182141 RepID=UPI003F9A7F4A
MDWSLIKSEDQFYDLLLSQVGAPNWHGHNLDTIAESLIAGSINSNELPYKLMYVNSSVNLSGLKPFKIKVLMVFSEAAIEQSCEIEFCVK